jgi:PadR family transcriptional regulator PadR
MNENENKEIVQRITRNLLDIQLLRLVHMEPMWGYKIKKQAEIQFNIKLRHGAMYPMLNLLEKKGYLTHEKQQQAGRARKVYTITGKGQEYLNAYYEILKSQIEGTDLKKVDSKE